MKKLINVPEEILKVLKEYKKQTGINASAYIVKALYKQMINDNLIKTKTVTIYIDKETGNIINVNPLCDNCNKVMRNPNVKINAPDESVKFCDGDKCEVQL